MIHVIKRSFSSAYNVAVVGSGPAGFYTVQKLLKNPNVCVDIYEKLPVPFGLVRYGVAPDHADVKNVIKSFSKIAESNRVNFYGNISLGHDLSIEDLSSAYNAVVLAYGASHDKFLNIDGEQTTNNTISARNFVGWYNGMPEDKDLKINLDCDTACIIGNGNVALDCARILLKPQGLHKTDITSYSHEALAKSRIKRIYIIGRRGPIQTSFTSKELRQLIELSPASMRIEPDMIFKSYAVNQDSLNNIPRRYARLGKMLMDIEARQTTTKLNDRINCIFKFLSKPVRIESRSDQDSNVGQLVLRDMFYDSAESFLNPEAKPSESEDEETLQCGLILRSIGYKATLVDPKLPYNHKIGAIANTNGRIHGFKNLYCSGWLATGAVGVIAGTLNSSTVTAHSILTDIEEGKIGSHTKEGSKYILKNLKAQNIKVVHFKDWLKIDELEKRMGELVGKSREKLVDIDRMLEIASSEFTNKDDNR